MQPKSAPNNNSEVRDQLKWFMNGCFRIGSVDEHNYKNPFTKHHILSTFKTNYNEVRRDSDAQECKPEELSDIGDIYDTMTKDRFESME